MHKSRLEMNLSVDNGPATYGQVVLLGEGLAGRKIEVEPGETDRLINETIDCDDLIQLVILSDRAVTVKTNDAISPQETFELAAGVPVLWYEGIGTGVNDLFAGDVDSFFVTNAGTGTANLTISILKGHPPTKS